MNRFSRDFWLAIGLFLVLAAMTAATAIWQTRQETALPPLASFSSAPDGGRALRLWLQELGFAISDEVPDQFRIPNDASLALILEPMIPITAEEWEIVDAWVEGGGVLVLVGEGWTAARAVRHYDFDLFYLGAEASELSAETPLLSSPPLTSPVNGQAQAYFWTERDDFVVHLADEARPVLLSFQQGAGRVILSAAPFPLSNAGLKEEGNPALALNLVAIAGDRSGLAWFDEWHHGVRASRMEVIGPWNWLRRTPAGRSLLFVAAVIFLALALQGRRFGRPVPLPQALSRRAPLEYVTAIANLNRRAGHRSALLSQCHQEIKRGLGRRYRLNPTLPDDEYLAQLASFNPNLDVNALGELLARLRQANVSEWEMIQLAAQAADWLKEV